VTDPLDTREPVTGVSAEHRHLEIAVAVGHPILLAEERLSYDIRITDATLARIEDPHPTRVVDELKQVPVTGHDVDLHCPTMAVDEGADDVVGLIAGGADPGKTDRPEQVTDDRHLRSECLG